MVAFQLRLIIYLVGVKCKTFLSSDGVDQIAVGKQQKYLNITSARSNLLFRLF